MSSIASREVQRFACAALARFASDDAQQSDLAAAGAVESILDTLRVHEASAEVRRLRVSGHSGRGGCSFRYGNVQVVGVLYSGFGCSGSKGYFLVQYMFRA